MNKDTLRPIALLIATLLIGVCVGFLLGRHFSPGIVENPFVVLAEAGGADMSERIDDFPRTYISDIHVDLTGPDQWISLEWSGPQAASQDKGPFHSSPGRGTGRDCNNKQESQRDGSCCTPKGIRYVEGFNEYLPSRPECKFVTWFHLTREIAFHSSDTLPNYPSSFGCVRVSEEVAQLIHNNSLKGKTRIVVDGEWNPPPDMTGIKRLSKL
jgi:hypothetical protein